MMGRYVRHEHVDKTIAQVLAHREWSPLLGLDGYDVVVEVVG